MGNAGAEDRAETRLRPRSRTLPIAGGVCAALFAFAFVAAPRSCEWGLEAYFGAGVAAAIALFALPLVLERPAQPGGRFGLALALPALVCVTWVVGLFAANVRIMCRLF